MSLEPSDEELLAGIRSGAPTSWPMLVRRYDRLVYAVARRLRLSPEQCEDIAQTTWLKLVENVDRLRDGGAVAGWLVTTARREAYGVLRQERRDQQVAERLHGEALTGGATTRDVEALIDDLTMRDVAHTLDTAVAALPSRQRELVRLLLEPECPSYAEVSRRLDMPVGAVGPVRQRALCRLRTKLERSGAELPMSA
jgi:RNA polymerase sigma factor (sigma-70 family)